MAQVTTIDITPATGASTFPVNVNDAYGLIETLAVQNIRALKSTNRIVDGFYDYDVADGKVIEEAVIQMAQRQPFNKVASPNGTPNLSPLDPKMFVKYFNNWETSQFKTTIRRDDIRAIVAKGTGVEEVVSEILASLSEGEGYYDYLKMYSALELNFEGDDEIGEDASTLLGGKPTGADGIIYAIRQMYNIIKATNTAGNVPAPYAVPVEDIRIAISEDVLNILDVTKLANVFNLEKVDLFGKLVVLPHEDNEGMLIRVYDRKAFGRATRIFDYTQDILGGARYTNHYLTTERAYFFNGLFKSLSLDVSSAVEAEKAKLIAGE